MECFGTKYNQKGIFFFVFVVKSFINFKSY